MALDPVQEIKERLNIVDIISQYVKLTKAGKNYKGLSPFKKEKTPSFYVNPDKGMYYDFSSNQGGDVFTFVQSMEGLDFKGALQLLADRAGVEVRHEPREAKSARERQYVCMEDACRFFETAFAENVEAREYIQSRGVEPDTMRQFRIGFAPNDWQRLYDHLQQKGYSGTDIEKVGLAKRNTERGTNASYYDRFRSRIMFPITDVAGRVVAFSGRIFGEPSKDDKNAKYLNSPETDLYNKGRILYGYDKAKQHIRKYDFSILVEGQMDIVMSHQAGYQNTVAVSGTGLTERHLDLLNRLSPKVVLAFDADTAGVASTGRAATLALRRGMEVKVVTIPAGKDPADCIAQDPALWKKAIREAQHVVDFFITCVQKERMERNLDERRFTLRIRDVVLPYVARIHSGVDQAHFVKKIATLLSLGEDAIWLDVRTVGKALQKEESHQPQHSQNENDSQKHGTTYSRQEELERELVGFLCWQENLEKHLSEDALWRKAESYGVSVSTILSRHADEHSMLAMRAEVLHGEAKDPLDLVDQMLIALAREQFRDEQKSITRKLRSAEATHDDKEIEVLLGHYAKVSQRLEALDTKS